MGMAKIAALTLPDLPETEACKKLGNLIVCMHYLSIQACRDGLPQAAEEIDRAIVEMARAGHDIYLGHLQASAEEKALCPTHFIEDFCPVTDDAIMGSLISIVQERA